MKLDFALFAFAALTFVFLAYLFAIHIDAVAPLYKPAGYVQYSDGWRYYNTCEWGNSCFDLSYLQS